MITGNLIKIIGDDPFDPNNWVEDDHEHRIYADGSLELYAVVDGVDYTHLCRFKYCVHTFRVDKNRMRPQLYLRRSVTEFFGSDGEPYISEYTGKLVRNRKRITRSRFLHQDVMLRKGDLPLTDEHVIIDHEDRDTLNCRRGNLNWATYSANRLNNVTWNKKR